MIGEKDYIKKVDINHRKKFAQFFTPIPIADFMAEWVIHDIPYNATILDPAFGLGVFYRSTNMIVPDIAFTGFDIDETIYNIALRNFSISSSRLSLINENYLTSSWEEKYNGIICNPPYLKFHDYDNSSLIPLVNKKLGIHLNGFTNIYTLFLLKSIIQLKDGGRLAYIIPSEFLNSDYGVEVKRFLLRSNVLRHIVIIDFTKNAFDDALTTACILLCEKSGYKEAVRFSCLNNIKDLHTVYSDYIEVETKLLDPEIKWKQYYGSNSSTKYCHLVPFTTFAKVTRGIATGANAYFTFKQSKKELYNIPDNSVLPCICHAIDIQNQIFTKEDFEKLVQADKSVFLFNGCSNESNRYVSIYIRLGVDSGIDKKYLTASRSPWYAIENRKPSPIWATVFNRSGLRFIRNKAGIYNLTTFHCVYTNDTIETDILFAYLITEMAKEIFLGNSRQYGNGLIKFEPNDLNKSSVVDLRLLSEEEKIFIKRAYERLYFYGSINRLCINLLDSFFRIKYTDGDIDIDYFFSSLDSIKNEGAFKTPTQKRPTRVRQVSLVSLFDLYGENNIVENNMVHEDTPTDYKSKQLGQLPIDELRNVLISYIKKENEYLFLNRTKAIYYTGKKFPSTIDINRLYYFMPYIKGKGVRDLWLIRYARLGYQHEGQTMENTKDIRLVFEIEYVRHLFSEYKPIELKIWRTFTNTTIKELRTSII